MKQLSKIVVLAVVIAAIVVLWLMPGVNQAKNTTYVRIYEDTDVALHVPESRLPKDSVKHKDKNSKKYKVEKIKRKKKPSQVSMKMFSRVAHFEEIPDSTKILAKEIKIDSLNQ